MMQVGILPFEGFPLFSNETYEYIWYESVIL